MTCKASLIAGVIASLSLLSVAHATTLDFSYSGLDGSSFSFVDSSMPVATADPIIAVDGTRLAVTGLEDGVSTDFSGYIEFYGSKNGGGFNTGDFKFNFFSAPLFTGSDTAPTFFSTSVTTYVDDNSMTKTGVLTVSSISAAPEPSAWALMIAGLGAAGLALRHARRDHGRLLHP